MGRVVLTFRMRERVLVDGHEEVFAVVRKDEARAWADLACVERVGFLIHVPLEKIRPAAKKQPKGRSSHLGSTE